MFAVDGSAPVGALRSARSARRVVRRSNSSSVIETWYVCGLHEPAHAGIERVDVGLPAPTGGGQVGQRLAAAVDDDRAAVDDGHEELVDRARRASVRSTSGRAWWCRCRSAPGVDHLVGRRQHVGGRPAPLVVHPPQPLGAGVEDLDR